MRPCSPGLARCPETVDPVPTPFPLHGLLYAPRSDSPTRARTWLPGGVPRNGTLTVIVVKVDGERKA